MEHCDFAAIEALLPPRLPFQQVHGAEFPHRRLRPRRHRRGERGGGGNGVLEIGPGIGALSHELCRRAAGSSRSSWTRRCCPFWMRRWRTSITSRSSPPISSRPTFPPSCARSSRAHAHRLREPALQHHDARHHGAARSRRCFESITVLVQKEVAERLCAAPGTAAYGAFSVYMQYHTAPRLLFEVGRECFQPQPKVTSAVLRAEVRKTRRRSRWRTRNFSSASSMPPSPCAARRSSTA